MDVPVRRVRLLAAVVGLGLAGAACGGGGEKAATPVAAEAAPGETTTTVAGATGAAYTACLRDHGVDAPDRQRPADGTGGPPSSRPQGTGGTGGGPPSSRPAGTRPSTTLPAGVDQAKLSAAREACKSLQPADGPARNGPPSQAFEAYTSCMKDHGVTVAGGGQGGGPGGGVNRDDPAFKAADAICGVLRPTPSTTP